MADKVTGSFTARDTRGNAYTIVITQRVDHGIVSPIQRLQTSEGSPVNRVSRGKYQILGGLHSIDVTSDDSEAP